MTQPIDSIGGVDGVAGASSSQFTQARQDALNAVASQLGMSATDLRSAMSQGETLAQLAASKGVSASDLQNTIETALKKDLPGASSSQVSGIANRMMSGAHHAHGGHHAGGSGGASGANSASSPSGADATGDGNISSSAFHVVA